MEDNQFDVAVIGAGTAGLTARRTAVEAGARTLIVEAGPWGTTCVRVGCMPSKLLLASARAARGATKAPLFGTDAGTTTIDGRAVMARLHGQRDRFLRGIYDELDSIPEKEKMRGRARFIGPTTLLIDDRVRVRAKAIVIATGARSSVPKALEPVKDRVLTNETVFELDDLPRSIAVVGAGPLGIELGAAFTRLGVRTMVFDKGESLGGLKDPEVGRIAKEIFGRELDLRLGAEIEANPEADGARIRWHASSGQGEAMFEWVLAATGRQPNLKGLDLEAAGLALDDHGVPKYDRASLRCGDSPVFIAGDANHDRPVLHEASREGRIAGANAARLPTGAGEPPDTALSIVFTDPDMAAIGKPLTEMGEDAGVGCCDFNAGRGLIEGRSDGIIRVYARRGNRVIAGGEMVGPAVEHLAHLVAILIQQKVTADAALKLPFYHPTYEEGLRDCLRDLVQQLS
jgi:dihydrolipoamide dehydrogenase